MHMSIFVISLLMYLVSDPNSMGGVQSWTYTSSTRPNRNWSQASQWCQKHFTGMVPIQSQAETDYLNNLLPYNPKYYWIGIQRKDEVWIWSQTGEKVPEEVQNWSPMEPDNITGQDCVEIYIKREKSTGKWNNESCRKKKGTICYSGKDLLFSKVVNSVQGSVTSACLQSPVCRILAVLMPTAWRRLGTIPASAILVSRAHTVKKVSSDQQSM